MSNISSITEKQLIINNIINNVNVLRFASPELTDNYEFMINLIKLNFKAIEYVSSRLLQDPEFCNIIIRNIINIPFNDEEIILTLFDNIDYFNEDNMAYIIYNISHKIFTIKFILKIISIIDNNTLSIMMKYIPYEFKNNEIFILDIIKSGGINNLHFASDTLKNDQDFIIKLIREFDLSLFDVSENMLNNKDVVLNSVRRDGYQLQYASSLLLDDPEVVMVAIKNFIPALYYASERLRKDQDFIINIIKKNFSFESPLRYASEELCDNYDFMIKAIRENISSLDYVSNNLLDNRLFMIEVIKQDEDAIERVSSRLKKNFNNYIRRKNYLKFLSTNIFNENLINNTFTIKKIQFIITSFI